MSMEAINNPYVLQERVRNEALQWGVWEFSPSLSRLGFTTALDPQQVERFAKGQRADGSPCLRVQKNQGQKLYGQIFDVHWTISTWWGSQPLEVKEKIAREDMPAAMAYGIRHMDKTVGYNRRGAGGKIIEKSDLAYLMAVHGWSAVGDPLLHGHVWFRTSGITPEGRTNSLAYKTGFMREDKEAQLLFNIALAARLEQNHGVKVAVENSKAFIPALLEDQEAKQLVGSRKREALKYLEEKGIEPTPWAIDTAIHYTRPKEIPNFDKHERSYTWIRKAEHVQMNHAVQGHQQQDGESRAGMWGRVLSDLVATAVVGTIGVWWAATKAAYGINQRNKLVVHDVGAVLFDMKKKSRMEGHKAALRALRKQQANSLNEALDIARQGFLKGRKPKLVVPKRSKVVVTKEAWEQATTSQKEQLLKAAGGGRWDLKVRGLEEDQVQKNKTSQRHGY